MIVFELGFACGEALLESLFPPCGAHYRQQYYTVWLNPTQWSDQSPGLLWSGW